MVFLNIIYELDTYLMHFPLADLFKIVKYTCLQTHTHTNTPPRRLLFSVINLEFLNAALMICWWFLRRRVLS